VGSLSHVGTVRHVPTRSRTTLRTTFSALRVRNFRLYFTGQIVSVSGAWMQRVAQAWLVLDLTGSGTAVGGVTALQFLPLLIAAPFGGVVADRVDKRRLLFITQSLAGLTAATLGLLVLTDRVELWMVYALAFVLGVVGSFDNPARQAFVMEMVGRERITNAVALNSVMVNAARILGPAVAGVLIVTVGIAACFLLNAASYLALLTALALMRARELDRAERQPRRRGQLREGFTYAADEPLLRTTLVMMAVIGIFAYEFEVSLPLLARFTFGGDADTFGLMFTAMGVGAVAGGLHTATRTDRTPASLARIAAVFGASIFAAAVAPALWMAVAALVVVGAAGTSFLAFSNAVLQLRARPEMRARVLALRAVAFLGMRPIGGPIVGAIGEYVGPRYGVGVGALATLLIAVWAGRALTRIDEPALEGNAAST
jgi:MFS family permease